MNDKPIQITGAQLAQINPSTEYVLYLGGIWGEARSGMAFLGDDGRRLVISASPGVGVFYVLAQASDPQNTGKIYIQSAQGFRADIMFHPLSEGARRAEHWVRIGEIEMQVLMGIAAACSGAAFVALIATDVLAFVAKNKDNFGKWSAAVGVAVAVREVMKKHAPTLYDKLIDAALISSGAAITASIENLPAAVAKDPKLIGRMAGAIVGKLGKKAMTSRLTALSAVWILLSTLVMKAASGLPGALAITADDKLRTADAIILKLKESGVTITAAEVRKIVEEVAAHPTELKDSLRQLQEAFEAVKVD